MIIPLQPRTIRAPFAAYSHGVLAPPNAQLLFASGQLGVSPDDHIPESVEEQAVLCFENIKEILASAGMGFDHVVRFSAFVTDRAHFPIYGAVRSRYVTGDAFASTLLIVSGFTLPQFKIEVEVTAAQWSGLPKGLASG
jgi:2-iminobutanoate/2-iminopropanoate deaminase